MFERTRRFMWAAAAKITPQRSVKGALAVAGVGAVALGVVALAAPAAIPALATAKVGELMVAGCTALATSASLTKPKESATVAASSTGAPPSYVGPQELEIEKIRDLWRRHALDAGLALLAYIAIAVPVGFLVFSISAALPVSSMVIVACYAYVGLAKFLGFDEFFVVFRRIRAAPADESAVSAISEPASS